jgi:thiol-disulfide isomerase/thioredoxin
MKTPLIPHFLRTKLITLTLVAVWAAGLLQNAGIAAPAPQQAAVKSEADKEFEALWAPWSEKLPEGDPKKRDYWKYLDQKITRLAEEGIAFYNKHPNDPRRWKVILQIGYRPPFFLKGFNQWFDAVPEQKHLLVDEVAAAKFKEGWTKRMMEAIEASDTPEHERLGAYRWFCIEAKAQAAKNAGRLDLSVLQPLTDRLLKRFPNRVGADIAACYQDLLKSQSHASADAFGAKITSMPIANAVVEKKRDDEEGRINRVRATELKQLKFFSADGRQVDVAAMRGKVVLIDFWATWCGPCVSEIPNIVANYRNYHGKGFEIVGVSMESSPAAKANMLAFARSRGMEWPQYFDGKGWKNDLAQKFNIHSLPAMFLLDKRGDIVSSNARGPELEREIKRLLGL